MKSVKQEVEYIFGKHAVAEALAKRPDIVAQVYVAPDFSDRALIDVVVAHRIAIKPLKLKNPPRGVSANANHQGVVAGIIPSRLMVAYKPFIEAHTMTPDSAFLLLGEVQDPHNVGAVIRSAAAFGLSGVLIPPHHQAPVTGTVVKVSAGMAFAIPLVAISNVNAVARDLQERGCFVYGLDAEGTTSTTIEKFTRPSVFILGNEGSGMRQKTRALCDAIIAIPIHPQCESLNVAAATAVVLAAWSAQHQTVFAQSA